MHSKYEYEGEGCLILLGLAIVLMFFQGLSDAFAAIKERFPGVALFAMFALVVLALIVAALRIKNAYLYDTMQLYLNIAMIVFVIADIFFIAVMSLQHKPDSSVNAFVTGVVVSGIYVAFIFLGSKLKAMMTKTSGYEASEDKVPDNTETTEEEYPIEDNGPAPDEQPDSNYSVYEEGEPESLKQILMNNINKDQE